MRARKVAKGHLPRVYFRVVSKNTEETVIEEKDPEFLFWHSTPAMAVKQ
jgi:hypothetical protein